MGRHSGISTYAERKILHHVSHAQSCHGIFALTISGSEQILDASIGVDLHRAQVRVAIDQAGLLSELLTESVAQVVCGIG